MRATFIYEYGHRTDDSMMSSLISAIGRLRPDLSPTYLHGFLTRYRPGGMRPSRLVNLIWIYLRVSFHLLLSRPDVVIVRTTPPCIQLWTARLGAWLRIPVICWLMDYHPEMEARGLDARGYFRLARILRKLDEVAMCRFSAIVTLDGAMMNLARSRAPGVPIIQHPTWSVDDAPAFEPCLHKAGSAPGFRRFAYAGNLGAAHAPETFGALLRHVAALGAVELHVIGASPGAESILLRMSASAGVVFFVHPRVAFAELGNEFARLKIDIGVVLLADESVGLVSPSKFSAYIRYGIPVLYIGPTDTNADAVVTRFGGGFGLRNNVHEDVLTAVGFQIWDTLTLSMAVAGVRAAAINFGSLNGETLALELAPYLPVGTTRRDRETTAVCSSRHER